MIGYMTAKDKAKQWGVSDRMVQVWCGENMIDGVVKFGHASAIPEDAEKPTRTINQKPGRKPKSETSKVEKTTEAL